MEIKLKNLVVTDYDSRDMDKVKFVRDVANDKDIRRYVSNDIDQWLMRPHYTNDALENCVVYMVKDKDKIVGLFKPAVYYGTDIGLDYAVHPDFRRKGYGTKILLEVSDYFFDRNVERVSLCIDNTNIGSINAAINAGFGKRNVGYQMITEYVKERKV